MEGTLETLYKKKYPSFLKFALEKVKNIEDAEDIVQEACCDIINCKAKDEKMKDSYIIKSIENTINDHIRKKGIEEELYDEVPDVAIDKTKKEHCRKLIKLLKEIAKHEMGLGKRNKLLFKGMIRGMTIPELARMMDMGQEEVSRWKDRLKNKLIRRMRKLGNVAIS